MGQGGPPDDDLVNLWTQLAQHYVYSDNIVFGIMNEPHTLDINVWRDTVQAVVTAIRQAGATTQWILLPGTAYTSATGFQISSAPGEGFTVQFVPRVKPTNEFIFLKP